MRFWHEPVSGVIENAIALTHGAGTNSNAPLLVKLAEELAAEGWLVLRYDLPYREKRPGGPPHPSGAAADRAGVVDAARTLRDRGAKRVILGGHSYGGRMTSMAAAGDPQLCDALLLLSYPLHPPGKAEWRTQHFPGIRMPVLFVSGERDEFATPEELAQAAALLGGKWRLRTVPGQGHSLRPAVTNVIRGELKQIKD